MFTTSWSRVLVSNSGCFLLSIDVLSFPSAHSFNSAFVQSPVTFSVSASFCQLPKQIDKAVRTDAAVCFIALILKPKSLNLMHFFRLVN